MAIPSSGPLTLAQIQTEFGGTNPINLSEYYRNGGYVTGNNTTVPTSGAISLSNFYGTSNQFAVTINTSYTTPQNLRTLALGAGWDGAAPLVVTISSGVTISSNTTSSAALTVSGSFPGGVSLINQGTLIGMGGAGGFGGYTPDNANFYAGAGGAGGAALLVATALTVTNSGVFAGGGGGGGGGAIGILSDGSGGGGGGGRSGAASSSGGAFGYAQQPFNDPAFPGTAGTSTAAGTGGLGYSGSNYRGGTGGDGGEWGQAGQTGGCVFRFDASTIDCGRNSVSPGAGGAAGPAVSGSGFVTWVSTGTQYGPWA